MCTHTQNMHLYDVDVFWMVDAPYFKTVASNDHKWKLNMFSITLECTPSVNSFMNFSFASA